MIHPAAVSLFQAWILVAVCIQTVGTKPENEYTVTGKLSTREVEVAFQVKPCRFGRIDLNSEWYQIFIFCSGITLAPVSYCNGSDVPPCEADAPDDARSCIHNYLNSSAEGMQSVILPAGVEVKIGTDEREPKRLNGCFTPNQKICTSTDPEPGKNGTDPSPTEPDCAGTIATTTGIVLVISLIAGGSVTAVLLILCIHYYRKARRLQRFCSTEREPNVNERGAALEHSLTSIHIPDEDDTEVRGDESQPASEFLLREPSIPALTRSGPRSRSLPRSASCSAVLNYSGQNKEISTSAEESQVSPREEMNQEGTALLVGSSTPAQP